MLLQRKIADGERTAKELRDQQRSLKDVNSGGLSQIDMMQDMIKLLELKMEYQTSQLQAAQLQHQAYGSGAPGSGQPVQWPGLMNQQAGDANVFVL